MRHSHFLTNWFCFKKNTKAVETHSQLRWYKLHYFFYKHLTPITHKLWMMKMRLKYKHLLAK